MDMATHTPNNKMVRVVILDDHQSIIDGYLYRLGQFQQQIEVVGATRNGAELEEVLAAQPADVLILDVNVDTASDDHHPYPILHIIPKFLQTFPEASILVISMVAERALISAVMEAGARGYILKDENEAIQDLGSIVLSIARGDNYVSPKVQALLENHPRKSQIVLTVRQSEALSLCAAHPDWSRTKLADAMSITPSSARNLLAGAYYRLGVNTLAAAVDKARALGLITPLPVTVAR
jgi:DNA-binding NarL/FixJ family response regulator